MTIKKQISYSFPQYPYFDDYDAYKLHQSILFKPSANIQTRELNQLQTLIQEQIARFGSSIFKNGSIVVGCNNKINITVYTLTVKLNSSIQLSTNLIEYFKNVGYICTKNDVTKIAKIIEIISVNSDIITYQITINDFSENQIAINDIINLYDIDKKIQIDGVTLTVSDRKSCTLISLDKGYIFLDGYFVSVPAQKLVLDSSSASFSGSAGLTIDRKIININGQDGLQINLILESKAVTTNSTTFLSTIEIKENFIELIRMEQGNILKNINRPIYSDLETTLARRTYDQWGSYTITPFNTKVIKNNSNDPTMFSLEVSQGKAYVLGYEFETTSKRFLDLDRALDTEVHDNFEIAVSYGCYIRLTQFKGFFDIQTCEVIYLLSDILSNINLGPGGNWTTTLVGSARVRHVAYYENELWLYLFDIRFYDNKTVGDIKSVVTKNITKSNMGQGNLILSTLYQKEASSLIFSFPEDNVKTLYNDAGKINSSYFIQKTFFDVVFNPSPDPATTDPNITFASLIVLQDEQLLLNQTDIYIVNKTTGEYFFPDQVTSIDDLSTQIQLTVNKPTFTADIFAKVYVYFAKENKKVITTKDVKLIFTTNNVIPTDGITPIPLDVPDGISISNVYYNNNDVEPITGMPYINFFTLVRNNTKDYYHNSYLLYTSKIALPPGTLTFTLEYYKRRTDHGYFSVDSYPNYDSIPEEKILTDTIKLNSAIDFRPDIINETVNNVYCPVPDSIFECSFSFYLSRIDKLVATASKDFQIIQGIPAKFPVPPADSDVAMTLYVISIPAYSAEPKSVKLKYIENKRYTMRDIGKLEKRIENLEYYTALSLLEKDTKDMQILDEHGNNRFKNGFLVDNFKDYKSVDMSSVDSNCALDTKEGILRPSFTTDNMNLLYNPFYSSTRRTGDLVTLPYVEIPYIEQLKASETINLQPFEVFNYEGSIVLLPETDEWVDTTTAPSVIANQMGATDVWAEIGAKAFSTVWGSWEDTILSVPPTTDLNSVSHVDPSTIKSASVKKLWNPSVDSHVDQTLINTYNDWVSSSFTAGFAITVPDGFVNNQPAIFLDFKGEVTDSSRTGSNSAFTNSKIITNETSSSVTDVGIVSFIREKNINFTAKNLSPNTDFFAFFDDDDVTDLCLPDPPRTDDKGMVTGLFMLPGGKYKTGVHDFTLKDSKEIYGVNSYASTKYTAKGLKSTNQSAIISTREPVLISDPVKESKDETITAAWNVDKSLILPITAI